MTNLTPPNALTPPDHGLADPAPPDTFAMAERVALLGLSDKSQRVYADTYNKWRLWCAGYGVETTALNAINVDRFLRAQSVTLTTRQRMLSSLRKIAQIAFMFDPDNSRLRAMHESLKLLKASKDQAGGRERDRRSLSTEEVERILDVWLDDSLLHVRNHALMCFMFATGARRAEIAVIRWRDIDLGRGIVNIRHGKGDKDRDATIFGDFAINALKHWQAAQGGKREFVFCPMTEESNGGALGRDKSMGTDNVHRIVIQTGEKAGVLFKAHDARRSLATELLRMGLPLSEVQQQLGHSLPATTLRYSFAGSAQARRETIKHLPYGD